MKSPRNYDESTARSTPIDLDGSDSTKEYVERTVKG